MQLVYKSLKLQNWGPFVGPNNEIRFSTDPARNVTYILAKNGSGKTNLFEAFKWCLFGTTEFAVSGEAERAKEPLIFNKDALSKGDLQMQVQLTFEHVDDRHVKTEYFVRRQAKISRDGTSIDSASRDLTVTKSSPGGAHVPVDEPTFKRALDGFIPQGPRPFFFLDGEKLAELFTPAQMSKVESYATALSDVGIVDGVAKRLEGIFAIVDATVPKGGKAGLSAEADRIGDRIQDLRKQVDTDQKRVDEMNKDLEAMRSRRAILEKELKEYEDIKENVQRLAKAREDLKEARAALGPRYDQLNLALYQDGAVLRVLVASQVRAFLREMERIRTERKIPPKFPKSVVEEAERGSHCTLCGSKASSETRKHLKGLLQRTVDDSVADAIRRFSDELARWDDSVEERQAQIASAARSVSELEIESTRLDEAIVSESKYVPKGLDVESALAKWKEFAGIVGDEGDRANAVQNEENALFYLRRDLQALENKRLGLLSKDSRARKIAQELDAIDRLKRAAASTALAIQESIRSYVEKRTSDWFVKIIWDKGNWKSIKIAEHWDFQAIAANDQVLPGQRLSMGQRHVLGISFMSALGEVTGNRLPLLFDSPFGRVSQEPIETIGGNLRQMMGGSQVVLFVTDTEDKFIRPSIGATIGASYRIEKDTATKSHLEVG